MSAAEAWVAFSFIIFLVIAYKPGRKALLGMIDDKTAKVRAEIEEAEQLHRDAMTTLTAYRQRLEQALKEAEEIIAHARESAETMRREGAEELERAVARREAQALDRIAQAEATALSEVRDRAVDAAVAAAHRLLVERLDASTADRLVDEAVAGLPARLH